MRSDTSVSSFVAARKWSRTMSSLQLLPRLRRAKNILPLAVDLALVFFLFALDLRDIYYKLAWIGPFDTFSFYAISSRGFDSKLLTPSPAFTYPKNASVWANVSDTVQREHVSVAAAPRESGWLPMVSTCERAHTAGASLFFVGVMGENCTIGPPGHTATLPQFYMSGSVRPDSMAWAACKLLFLHRRPPICSANIVTGFLDRYGFEDRVVTREHLARPETPAETELLALLLVISKSHPLYQTTCIEGYAYDRGPGVYRTTLFGCGSPNVLESAFVGVHATNFARLHHDMAWLTADTVKVMGLKYTMRQNCISEFTMSVDETTGALLQSPNSITNFSSSGVLYLVVIVVDVVLMLVHLWSAMEIARLVLIPLMVTHLHAKKGDGDCDALAQDYQTVFTCSLYRSRPIVVMTIITQVLSWIIILPNSIIWTWSTSSKMAKMQAYLSSLRLWVLILVVVNEIWDVVVTLHEPFAYAVTKRTYISSLEIITIGAVVSYTKRKVLFAVTDAKYNLEKQRNKDWVSYSKKVAFTNSFNEEIDYYLATPLDVLSIIYNPLFTIIGWSLVCVVGVLVLRFVAHKLCAAAQHWWRQRRQTQSLAAAKVNVVESIRQAGGGHHLDPTSELLNASVSTADPSYNRTSEPYKRLPLEELLNVPIRARSLVRGGMEVESETFNASTNKRETFIRPPYFLEHGIVIDKGTMRSRRGFFRFLQPKVDFKQHVIPAQTNAFQIMQMRQQLKKHRQQGKPFFAPVGISPAVLAPGRRKDK